MMRLYLSGPMRGLPLLNFPQFHSAAKWLRGQGYEVFNPAEMEDSDEMLNSLARDPLGVTRGCFARDTQWICTQADAVALLPGWHNSKGAKAECYLALAIGEEVYYLYEMPSGEWYLLRAEDLMEPKGVYRG